MNDCNKTAGPSLRGEAKITLRLDFPSNPISVRDALADIRAWQSSLSLPESHLDTTELVMAEILNNISEHAYGEENPGPVHLCAKLKDHDLSVVIRDEGRAMPQGKLPDAQLPSSEGPLDDLPEGGFGWFLVLTLTQDLVYLRSNDQNMLDFKIALAESDAA